MLSAADLYDRAVDDGNAGRHAASARLLARAADRTSDPDLLARIDGTLAYLEAERGEPDRGIDRVRAALATPGISAHTRAVLTSQLGLIALRRGDLDSAFDQLTASIEDLRDDPARLGRVVLNRGLVSLDRGDIRAAQLDFGAASDAFARSGERVEEAKARHNQGYTALVTGDLVGALRLMDDARSVLADLSPVALAVCDSDRAEALRAAGMTTDAARLLGAVARTFGSRRLRQMQADTELALARALLGTDPTRALAVALRAARRLRALGNETSALRADAAAIAAGVTSGRAARVWTGGSAVGGASTATGGERPGLRSSVDVTAARLEERGLHAEAIAVRLHGARLDVRAGLLAQAEAAIGVGSPSPTDAGPVPIETRLLSSEVGAELAIAAGDAPAALDRARAGLDELVAWQAAFGSIDLQSSAAVHGRTLALTGIRIAVGSGDPSVVFEWSERSRAMTSRIVPVRPPADPQLADELTELRSLRLLDAAGADIARETVLRESIRRGRWATEGSGGIARIVSLDEARDGLERHDADLVSYLWTGERMIALVVARDIRVVDLGPSAPVTGAITGLLADLDVAAATLPSPIATVVRAALADRLRRLDEVLAAPIRGLLSGRRIVISPTGVLSGVPWSMLPSFAGVPITLPVSVTRWLATSPPPLLASAGFAAGPGVRRAEEEVLAAAGWWVDTARRSVPAPSPADTALSPGSGDREGRARSGTAPTVLTGEAATTWAVAALASVVDVLHVSAHGRHSSENPLFSGVDLADGPWFGYDVGQLDRVPSIVVLSACEVGRSPTSWGRESLGMAQAWLQNGARCVIAAPASVNDDAACELLSAVSSALARRIPASDAVVAATGATGHVTPFQVYGSGW